MNHSRESSAHGRLAFLSSWPVLATWLTLGCADPGRQRDSFEGVAAAEQASVNRERKPGTEPSQPREQPAAVANGVSLSWEELRPLMAEACGGQIVQEALLDKVLLGECKSKGVSISEADVAAERTLLADAILRDARATPNDAERLLEGVRRSRGLGDERFRRLLERNARMRKLVAPDVEVSPGDVAQAFEMLHGVKYRVRVILTPGQAAAAETREELAKSDQDLDARFGALAVKTSTDPSADRGGLLAPFSDADPAYPSAVREAVRGMQPGQMSPVLGVDRGFAIVLLEERLPADGTKVEDVAAQITDQVRVRRERQAMDALGLRLVRASGLRVLDKSLEWSLNASRASAQP